MSVPSFPYIPITDCGFQIAAPCAPQSVGPPTYPCSGLFLTTALLLFYLPLFPGWGQDTQNDNIKKPIAFLADLVESPAGASLSPHSPEFLLSGGGVQSVLQLGFQSFQFLTQVPFLLFCLVPRSLLRFKVFLKLSNLCLQFSHDFKCIVLMECFVVTSVKTSRHGKHSAVPGWTVSQENPPGPLHKEAL